MVGQRLEIDSEGMTLSGDNHIDLGLEFDGRGPAVDLWRPFKTFETIRNSTSQ